MNKSLMAIVTGFLLFLQSLTFHSLGVSAEPSVKVLSRSSLGDTIEDGVGYGGISIGSAERDLLAKWGSPAQITPDPPRQNYLYSLDSGEFVSAQINNGRVEAVLLLLRSPLPPAPLKTKRGVRLGSSFAEVKKIYGNPDMQKGSAVLYVSQGIGFRAEGALLAAILIFRPGSVPY